MPWYESFTWAIFGAFFVYMCLHRTERIQDFFYAPQANWRVPVFDVVFFMLGAAIFTTFLIEPSVRREAFMAGATWEGAASGLLTRHSSGDTE